MTVKIRKPTHFGDAMQELELEEAKKVMDTHIQNGWIAVINEKAVNNPKIEDGDEILLMPRIGGG